MKRSISLRIDEKLWIFVKDKPNRSKYVEELIKQDIQQTQVKPIVQSVIDELMRNEGFFREVSERLKTPRNVAHVVRPDLTSPSVSSLNSGDHPCCRSATTRCKHWEFDSAEGWVNTLTGEIREA